MDSTYQEQKAPFETILSSGESVCPECLTRIPSQRFSRGDSVYLRKRCPEHGVFETLIWKGPPDYSGWQREKFPAHPVNPVIPVNRGCPYDCGLCPDHRQQPCCVLLEVTQRCNLRCPVCFASSGDPVANQAGDPDLDTISRWYQSLVEAGGPFNIQLSGGEPCLRDDLPEIIRLGKARGFEFFQVNTNGLRLAADAGYLSRLKDAGLSTVYLQFDGTDDLIYEKIRGRKLLSVKIKAIENCLAANVGVVLVPTLVPGVNTDNIGEMLRFTLRYHPGVRGIHFQPVSYFGRYPEDPGDHSRFTLPEIIRALEEQSSGLVKAENFKPSGGSHASCAFQGNFVVMPDGVLMPMNRRQDSCCQPAPEDARENRLRAQAFVSRAWSAPKLVTPAENTGPSLGGWDVFLERSRTHLLAISAMAFQDAWTFDLDRVRECYIMIVAPDGRLVPFCAYNLTDRNGNSLYRKTC